MKFDECAPGTRVRVKDGRHRGYGRTGTVTDLARSGDRTIGVTLDPLFADDPRPYLDHRVVLLANMLEPFNDEPDEPNVAAVGVPPRRPSPSDQARGSVARSDRDGD